MWKESRARCDLDYFKYGYYGHAYIQSQKMIFEFLQTKSFI